MFRTSPTKVIREMLRGFGWGLGAGLVIAITAYFAWECADGLREALGL